MWSRSLCLVTPSYWTHTRTLYPAHTLWRHGLLSPGPEAAQYPKFFPGPLTGPHIWLSSNRPVYSPSQRSLGSDLHRSELRGSGYTSRRNYHAAHGFFYIPFFFFHWCNSSRVQRLVLGKCWSSCGLSSPLEHAHKDTTDNRANAAPLLIFVSWHVFTQAGAWCECPPPVSSKQRFMLIQHCRCHMARPAAAPGLP